MKKHSQRAQRVGDQIQKELADLSITIVMINAWNRFAIGSRLAHPADRAKAA